ncbi:MAG: hypothetical protein JW990_21435 [Thermoleophilia bacterium]|nr:hypothetical protein [Thermoleophilia bacterium]
MGEIRKHTVAVLSATLVLLCVLSVGGCGEVHPASDEPTTILAPLDEATPAGKILKVTDLSAEGEVQAVWYLDPAGRRLRQEEMGAYTMENVTIYDETGHSSLSGVDLTVTPHGGVGYEHGYDLLDDFGHDEVAGRGTV